MFWSDRFPGDDIPIVRGSALAALKGENPKIGRDAIMELMEAVDTYFEDPTRPLDRAFAMPIEDVFSIQARCLLYEFRGQLHDACTLDILAAGLLVIDQHFKY